MREPHGVTALADIAPAFAEMAHRIVWASVATVDAQGRLRVAAAVSGGADALARARSLVSAGVDVIVVDSAHG